jgi:hypothetical protein
MLRTLFAAALAAGIAAPAAARAQAARLNGDVNNDGQVTAVDAQAVLTAVVDLSLPASFDKTYGDADCDGSLTARDAQIILSSVVQLDVSSFCVGKPSGAGVALVTVDAGTATVLVGGELQLAAAARDSTNKELTGKTVSWSTSDASRATVTGAGLVKGVAVGTVTITATVDGKAGSAEVTVNPAGGANTFAISPATVTVLKDSTIQLTATVRDAAGNPVSGKTITWSTSDAAKAIVSSTGLVKGLALGSVTITASSTGLTNATATVSVVSLAATANRSWTGTVSTDWSTAGNWNPSGVPIATDTISVPAGTPNQPELKVPSATVAGIVILPNAKLDLGANELQVTGRVDVDGQVTGTGKLTIQGLNQSTSYVRGALPNVGVAGRTVIVGPTTVNGSLEQVAGSVIDLNGFTVKVTKDLNARGTLIQNAVTSILDVRGNARFFNDQSSTQTVLSAGTIKVGGNFAVVVPPPSGTAVSPFPASGTHRVILDGAAKQVVADTGLTIVRFQELLVQNTAGGVEFTAPASTIAGQVFQVATRLTGSTATAISGPARLVVFSHFTSATGGSVSLRNLSVGGVLSAGSDFKPDTLTFIGVGQAVPAGQAYQYQNIVAAKSATLTGTTNVAGGLVLGCITPLAGCGGAGTLDVAGRKLFVAKNLQMAAADVGALYMKTNTDSVVIAGGVLGRLAAPDTSEFDVAAGSWLHGWLRVGGDLRIKGNGPGGQPGATHTVILDGPAQQKLQSRNGFAFQYLTIADSAGVVMNDTIPSRARIVSVAADLNINTAVKLTGSGRMEVAGNVQTTTGSSIENSVMSVGSILRASGGFTPDTAEFTSPSVVQTIQNLPAYNNVAVKGKAIFGGNMTFAGSLIVGADGELNVESRHVTVTKNMLVSGILRMQDSRDTITVLGDSTVFRPRVDPQVKNYVTAGVLQAQGHFIADSTGFYPTGSHRVVLSGNSTRRAIGLFQELEVAGTNDGAGNGLTLKSVNVNGSLTATSHTGQLIIDTVNVTGDALINPADSVKPAPSFRLHVGGNLTVRNFRASTIVGRGLVDGTLTLMNGGTFVGTITYRGNYVEEGTPANVAQANPVNGRLASIKWLQQPGSIVAGEPFTPTPSVELIDSTGARLVGTAVVTLPDPGNLLGGTKRVVTSNGVAVFTGLTRTAAINGTAITARASLPNGSFSQPLSSNFAVTAGAAALVTVVNGQAIGQVTAGQGPSFTVQVTDAFGNAVPYSGTLTIESGPGSPDTTYATKTYTLDAGGQAVVNGVQLRKAGTYTLVPVVAGLTGAASGSFKVVHTTASKLGLRVQPGNGQAIGQVTAGQGPSFTVQVTDAFGNAVPYSGTVTIESGPGSPDTTYATKTYTLDAGGQAVVNGVQLRKAGAYTLLPAVAGLTGVASGSFNVVHTTAAKLGLRVQPGNGTAGVNVSPLPIVEVQDAYGNFVDDYGISTAMEASITLVSAPPGAGTGAIGAATFFHNVPGLWEGASFRIDISSGASGAYVYKATFKLGTVGLTTVQSQEFTITK